MSDYEKDLDKIFKNIINDKSRSFPKDLSNKIYILRHKVKNGKAIEEGVKRKIVEDYGEGVKIFIRHGKSKSK